MTSSSAASGTGGGEVEALGQVARQRRQGGQLGRGLDSLGHHLKAEGMGEADRGGADGCAIGIAVEVLDETAIQLQAGEREQLQAAERGIAGAEIVDGKMDAQRLDVVQNGDGDVGMSHCGGLGDLQGQTLGRQPRIG
jgi:hypothetical protein